MILERERDRMPGQSEGDDCRFLAFHTDANIANKYQNTKSQKEVYIARCQSCLIAFTVSLFSGVIRLCKPLSLLKFTFRCNFL